MNSQRVFFQTKYADFWTSAVAESGHYSRALWSRVDKLSVPPDAPSSSPHTVQDFVTFFGRKVEDIRTATAAPPSPDIAVRSTTALRYFSPVSCKEITSILARTPSKSYLLDPMPTWLVKKMQEVLVLVICNLCNASLQHGVFPTSLKQAIVLPRLKKTTLDPCSLASYSYRPISNLTIISIVVERTVTSRLVQHAEENQLFPFRQS